MTQKERRSVRSIEIDRPVEVKFLDNEEHEVILCAEQHALDAIGDQQRLTTYNDEGDNVECLQTIEEKGDQRIKRRIETKTFVSEDPETKSKVTKVTKTETTEVTKVYLIKTDEDARKAALELGVSDMSQIIFEGSNKTKWKKPKILHTSLRRSPTDEFTLIRSGDGAILTSPTGRFSLSEHHHSGLTANKFGSLCSCAGRRRPKAVSVVEPSTLAHPSTIQKKIQETRISKKDNSFTNAAEPLISDAKRNIIQQHNLQLATFIFDLMCKLNYYNTEEEKERGRKVISRALSLLYHNRCDSWLEFKNQLWSENEEYKDTNHVVIPTADVIEYIFTAYPDMVGLIDSMPDDKFFKEAKTFIDRPFEPLTNLDMEGIVDGRNQKVSIEIPTLEISQPQTQKVLPDVISSPQQKEYSNLHTIIADHEKLGDHQARIKRGFCGRRCLSCFGSQRKPKQPQEKQERKVSSPAVIGAPAVHWPSIKIGNEKQDTPDIILVDRQVPKVKYEIGPPIEQIEVDTSELGEVTIQTSKMKPYKDQIRTETLIQQKDKPQNKTKIKMAETVDVFTSGDTAAYISPDKTHIKLTPMDSTEVKSEQGQLSKILHCHKCTIPSCGGQTQEKPSKKQTYDNICRIVQDHEKQKPTEKMFDPTQKDLIISMHDKFPSHTARMEAVTEQAKPRRASIGGVCTKCFSTTSKRHAKPTTEKAELISVSKPSDRSKEKTRSSKVIEAPSFKLPDIPLSDRHNPFLHDKRSLDLMKIRLNELFPGENANGLLDEIKERLDKGQQIDYIRSQLLGRYPLSMIDMSIVALTVVGQDYNSRMIDEDQVPTALVKALEASKISDHPSATTQTIGAMPARQGQFMPAKFGQSQSRCFPCGSVERKVTVPISPECLEILESLQRQPSTHTASTCQQIAERIKVTWNVVDKSNMNEISKLLKKTLPKLRAGQVVSLLPLRNDLKKEHLKHFYIVDPCVDAIQLICNQCDLSKPLSDAEIDNILRDVASKHNGIGLFSCGSAGWIFQPINLQKVISITEQRILTTSADPNIQKKRKRLNHIIQDAYNMMVKRQVPNTTELKNQLYRLYPKDSIIIEYVMFDIEEGIRSGRLQQECGRSSVRILINILHTKDIDSCRIQNGDDRLLSDRAMNNIVFNGQLLVSSIMQVLNDTDNDHISAVQEVRKHHDIEEIIYFALKQFEHVKSFEQLQELIQEKSNAVVAEALVTLIEQSYFATEFDDPCSVDALALMKDRLHGKPLVLREICFALPDDSTLECRDHDRNYSLSTSASGKLISVGQGLSWREANERARILFYRGKKPAVRYNDILEGFDVRMLLEQDGCVHEIPVSPDDVKRLLNSCGLYWDGSNISLLGKSDEIMHKAEQEAFKILRETGFLHCTTSNSSKAHPLSSQKDEKSTRVLSSD